MSARYYGQWRLFDAEGVERPAFLRVQLGVVNPDELNRLLEEFRQTSTSDRGEGEDVIAWLAERGIRAEIVPIAPGTF